MMFVESALHVMLEVWPQVILSPKFVPQATLLLSTFAPQTAFCPVC